jgi:beta-glucanase (GH16 family)
MYAHFFILVFSFFPELSSAQEDYTICGCNDPSALWCEEFSKGSSLNEQHWMYDVGGGGWGNIESQIYTKDRQNVRLEDDQLIIQATRNIEDGNYYSSRILTKDRVAFQYVRLEASIKVSNLEGGLWPAFWMLGANFAEVGWPSCGEIDIMELGNEIAIEQQQLHHLVFSALHWNGTNGQHKYDTNSTILQEWGGSGVQGFHTYLLDWTPEQISMSVDDFELFSKNITDLPNFQEPFFILLNLAVGGTFTGILQPDTNGGEMIVDWIRVFDNGSGSAVTVDGKAFNYSRGDCGLIRQGNSPSSGGASCTKRQYGYWVYIGFFLVGILFDVFLRL